MKLTILYEEDEELNVGFIQHYAKYGAASVGHEISSDDLEQLTDKILNHLRSGEACDIKNYSFVAGRNLAISHERLARKLELGHTRGQREAARAKDNEEKRQQEELIMTRIATEFDEIISKINEPMRTRVKILRDSIVEKKSAIEQANETGISLPNILQIRSRTRKWLSGKWYLVGKRQGTPPPVSNFLIKLLGN